MFIKLDSKDIKILESNAKSETSKVALQEYLSAYSKTEVAWKVFRDSLLLSENDVSKIDAKKERKFKAGDKVRVLDTRTPWAASFLRVGDTTKVVDYKEDQERRWSNPQQRPVVVEDFISKSNGYFEETALELVKEGKPQRKFKVGDTVRVTSVACDVATTAWLKVGDVTEVVDYKEDLGWASASKRPVIVKEKRSWKNAFFEESALELVEEKSPNELRAEVIKDAMEFIKKNEGKNKIILVEDNYFVVETIFIEDAKKKTVVVLLKDSVTSRIRAKGIAKCHPDDVFNADIGKAIALGRALGKDVSEFENAIQPTEPVVGHVVKGNETLGFYRRDRKFTLTSKQGDSFYYAETKEYEPNESDDFILDDQIGVIIDDTNAQYSSGTN